MTCNSVSLLMAAAALLAQTVPVVADDTTTDGASASLEVEEVVVSGSRISVPGIEAPTPVTSISASEIAVRGVSNVADFLNQLPAFAPTTTPTTTALDSENAGANLANLRGLGAQRTLVLIDGQRHVPTDAGGAVDLNVIPQALITRVDTVTGGASAAWGSDAVAGVVNIILDRKFNGFALDSRYGVSQHNDAQNSRFSVKAGGSFAAGQGHLVVGGDYERSRGILSQSDRSWSDHLTQLVDNPADTGPADGIPAVITVDGASLIVGSRGGHAWNGASAFGAPVINDPAGLLNVKFGPGGSVSAFNPGRQSGLFAVGGDGGNIQGVATLAVPVTRRNLMALLDYEISPHLKLTAEGSFAHTESVMPFVSSFAFLSGGPMNIGSDNPFLPASVRANMTSLGVASLPIWRSNEDLPPVTQANSSDVAQLVAGLSGDLTASWNWQIHYSTGRASAQKNGYHVPIPANYHKAADVIADPQSGQPVCRSVLDGTDPSCVPFNPFGVGAPSQAAIAYVSGTRFTNAVNQQQVASATLSGKVVEVPAGGIYAAMGIEHRRESFDSKADGLASTGQFGLLNLTPLRGEFTANEVFGELDVPLLTEVKLARELGLNAAVRYTDYSSSGRVTTWKVGSRWKPIADLTLRASYSKDIRAPSVGDLFSSGGSRFDSVSDPKNGGAVTFVLTPVGGNPNLVPEESRTLTTGIAYQPSWLDGFTVIADWYQIDLKKMVTALTAQAIVDRCFADGGAQTCSRITRNGAGAITSVDSSFINAAAAKARGVDFELSYGFAPRFVPGRIQLRSFGNYAYEKASSVDGVTFINRAGELGRRNTAFAGPKLRLTNGFDYSIDRFGAFMSARYVGGGVFDTTFTRESIDTLNIPGRTYFDVAAHYNFERAAGNLQVYAGVNNLANVSPPRIGEFFPGAAPTNAEYFDVIGRYFYVGLRLTAGRSE